MAERKLGLAVCHDCSLAIRQMRGPGWQTPATILAAPQRCNKRSFTTHNSPIRLRPMVSHSTHYPGQKHTRSYASTPRLCAKATASPSPALAVLHARILELTATALTPEDRGLPSEQRVLYALEQLETLARSLADAKAVAGAKQQRNQSGATATSALLGSVNARQHSALPTKESLLNLIGEKAEAILRHPSIFISPALLKAYIELQSLIHQPSSFPDAFALYAEKPVPKIQGDGSIEYARVSPSKANAAVDSKTASTALSAAMATHSLPLCIDIISTTFSAPAYKRAKILRQAVLPLTIVGLVPVAAYTLSTQFAALQTTLDPSYATGVAFAGIMTYVTTVCSLGYVVVTTANDQMDRVTWAKGVPLWERWIREEERAALDRVAGQWGFQSLERRGEEEGADWEALREYIGLRGMVLDRAELMEGME